MRSRARPGALGGTVPTPSARSGATFGDVLLVVAVIALVAAMTYPGMKARAHEGRLDAMVAEVETLVAAVERVRTDTGAWPAAAPAGSIAAAAPGAPDAPDRNAAVAFRLDWRRLLIAELPPPLSVAEAAVPGNPDDEDRIPPPPEPSRYHLGLVSVHAADDAVFDALLGRYGTARSFVHDTTWTLVLPRAPAPGR